MENSRQGVFLLKGRKMPIIPRYLPRYRAAVGAAHDAKRTAGLSLVPTQSSGRYMPNGRNAHGVNTMSVLSDAANQVSNVIEKAVDENHQALSMAANAKLMTALQDTKTAILSAAGENALHENFIALHQEAFKQKAHDILNTLPHAARKRSEIWPLGRDFEGTIARTATVHQQKQRAILEKTAFDTAIATHRDALTAAILENDAVSQIAAASSLGETRLARLRSLGHSESVAKDAARLDVNQAVMTSLSRYQAKLPLENIQTLQSALLPFLSDAGASMLQKIVDDKIQDEVAKSHAKHALNQFYAGKTKKAPDNAAITLAPAANGIIVQRLHAKNARNGVDKGAFIPVPGGKLTPKDLPQVLRHLNAAGIKAGGIRKGHEAVLNRVMNLSESLSQETGVPRDLLISLPIIESGLNPKAVSRKGAKGIAQFMDETVRQYNVNTADIASSMRGIAYYLRDLHQKNGIS